MRTLLLITGLLVILSCSTKDNRTFNNNGKIEDTVDINANRSTVDSLLLTNSIAHHFSSPTAKDTFKIKLTGRTIVDGNVEFEIKANNGILIHKESFPANYLIGYGLDQNASEAEKIDFIKGRVNRFFEDDHFHQPAISNDEPFEENFSNREIWFDIKSDPTAVSFYYLLGEEGNNSIAYSKKLRKTVSIFSCC